MLKIACVQMNPRVGDFSYNISHMTSKVEEAQKKNIDLLIFPELVLCGYPPLDIILHPWWIESMEKAFADFVKKCKGISVILGKPEVCKKKFYKKLKNCAVLIENGKIIYQYEKMILPNYSVFDELRYFIPGEKVEAIKWKGISLAITICEDLWYPIEEKGSNFYDNPLVQLKDKSIDLIVNISASPFEKGKPLTRKKNFTAISDNLSCPICFCNQWGAQDSLLFDGASFFVDAEKGVFQQAKYFEDDFLEVQLLNGSLSFVERNLFINDYDLLIKSISTGIRDYCIKQGFSKVLVALSGGIDSALVAYLAVKALGSSKVITIHLPTDFTSKSSSVDAKNLASFLKVEFHDISMQSLFEFYKNFFSLSSLEDNKEKISFENLQSRIRSNIMMFYSNQQRSLLLATSNKSEIATGFYTLYGDSSGALCPIGDLYKSEVFALAKYISKNNDYFLSNILQKKPSAELSNDQLDSDRLPEYEVLDPYLKSIIEYKKDPKDYDQNKLGQYHKKNLANLIHNQEYKRKQSPFVLKISSLSFNSMERRIPINSSLF